MSYPALGFGIKLTLLNFLPSHAHFLATPTPLYFIAFLYCPFYMYVAAPLFIAWHFKDKNYCELLK